MLEMTVPRNPQLHCHRDKASGNWDKKRSISEILGVYHPGPRLTAELSHVQKGVYTFLD
jgi:hypothetical protein